MNWFSGSTATTCPDSISACIADYAHSLKAYAPETTRLQIIARDCFEYVDKNLFKDVRSILSTDVGVAVVGGCGPMFFKTALVDLSRSRGLSKLYHLAKTTLIGGSLVYAFKNTSENSTVASLAAAYCAVKCGRAVLQTFTRVGRETTISEYDLQLEVNSLENVLKGRINAEAVARSRGVEGCQEAIDKQNRGIKENNTALNAVIKGFDQRQVGLSDKCIALEKVVANLQHEIKTLRKTVKDKNESYDSLLDQLKIMQVF